ncbi:TraH family protein [Denitrovibrio acetiphilus DSM 12809]|uniref:TraH family protein n=1 Tax=Denitrovibrio acetiphilus (strain DSM 12809 / NBRC 114555 / N2460) TaxID=522772 RepID=D4H452_DENA2|nr:conjugal transfer protein TraH [Denitrovibrio acetiphilus]ADD67363.1 TraH family protein [Denitrovibrio acetiphilus DSM 12809]
MFRTINVLLIALIMTPLAHANWVDDWFDANSSANASVYISQERGFATMGSFQGRLKTKSDYLMTVAPPKLSVGCGGIDIFMGGFSFLNPDYLVDKAERILRAAPYVAFDLALNEFCTSCSAIKDRAENIINALNGLQIDECKAAKGLVVSANHLIHGREDQAVDVLQKNMVQGLDTLFTDAKKDVEDKPGANFKKAVDNSGMSAELKEELKKSGSILDRIGSKVGMNTTQIRQIRALIGDVQVNLTDNAINAFYYPGCDEATYKKLIEGKPLSKSSYSSGCAESSGSNLTDEVQNLLQSISDKITTNKNTSLSAEEKNFVGITPYPVKSTLNTASLYGDNQVAVIRDTMLQPTLHGYAFAIFSNILVNSKTSIEEYKALVDSGDGKLTKQLSAALDELLKKTADKGSEARESYLATISDTENLLAILERYGNMKQVIDDTLQQNSFTVNRSND